MGGYLWTWQQKACVWVVIAGIIVGLGFGINSFVINTRPTYVTVRLLEARGLDAAAADEVITQQPVEFDVSIGLLHLQSSLAVAHDGGHIAISYAGIKLAEGSVSKFYVAGGRHKWLEATRAVASAGDHAPLSQVFRDHLWVDQQMHGEAQFDVALSFFNVNITTAEKTYHYHNCKVGLGLHGKAKPSKCGLASYFER